MNQGQTMQFETGLSPEVLRCPSHGASSCNMTKRYVAFPIGSRDRAGNMFRGFVLGLAEFGCLGAMRYDIAGYPYDSEAEALHSDWQAIGADMWSVIERE